MSIPIIIPLIKSKWGMEIRYSIRSWKKYFLDKHEIVVIGNYKKPWMECDRFIYYKQDCDGPHRNTAKIIRYAAEKFDSFIWSNDDIYLMKPITLGDLKIVYHGKDKQIYDDCAWCKLLNNTIVALAKNNNGQKNAETHTPYLYESSKVKEIFENYPIAEGKCLLRTAYANTFFQEKDMVDASTEAAFYYTQTKIDKGYLENKKFLNHNDEGLTEELKQTIANL